MAPPRPYYHISKVITDFQLQATLLLEHFFLLKTIYSLLVRHQRSRFSLGLLRASDTLSNRGVRHWWPEALGKQIHHNCGFVGGQINEARPRFVSSIAFAF